MTGNEYQEQARSTAVYPNLGNNIFYPAMGLAGEAGEVIDKCKKIMRGDSTLEEKREAIAFEISDCLWYCANLASELGYTLDDIFEMNINKLKSRQERNKLKGDGDNR